MKKILILSLAISVMFAIGGCAQERELPAFSDPPGQTSGATAPSGPDIDDGPATQAPADTADGPGDIDIGTDDGPIPAADPDDVKSWFADAVEGDWTAEQDSQSENITRETARLSAGGTVAVVSHFGEYHHTELILPDDGPELTARAEECLRMYIGRPLALSERDELSDVVDSIELGAPAVRLSSIFGTAAVYISRGQEGLLIQMI